MEPQIDVYMIYWSIQKWKERKDRMKERKPMNNLMRNYMTEYNLEYTEYNLEYTATDTRQKLATTKPLPVLLERRVFQAQ